MKVIRLFLFLLILFSCNFTEKNQQKEFEFFKNDIYKGDFIPLDTILVDLNRNKTLDTIYLFKEKEWNDPGDFQKMIISFDTKTTMVFYNTGDWINKPECREMSNDKSLLFIDGYTYDSSPQKYTIIDIDENNPRIIFNSNLDIIELQDLNNDGVNEIIGHKYYSESIKDYDSISYISTYSPFFIYEYINDTLVLNETLMEEYNLKHYIGYFGLQDMHSRYLIVRPFIKHKESFEPYFLNMIGRIMPESSLRLLNVEELRNFSKAELRLIRNEIFAFHGYIFDSQGLNEYFENQIWYEPISKNVVENTNKYERRNIETIQNLENK